MSEKITVARIKRHGKTFEIDIDSDNALRYKKGEITNLRDVLKADNVFTDVKKGLVASNDDLQKAFETTDPQKIADIILTKGEIQLNAQHRAQEREQKRKKLVHMIHINAIDPQSGLPHPPTRIEAALEQGKIHLDDQKSVEDQFDGIISKLRPIIPIKIEQKQLTVTIPSQFTGKAHNVVKSNCKVLAENWLNDGSWQVKIEIPAGLYQEFLNKVNGVTSGQVVVSE